MISLLVAAALVVGDRYEPARAEAWLCRDPKVAVKIGEAADQGRSPSSIKSTALAAHCESWTGGALNVRAVRRIDGKDVGLIRLVLGTGPQVEYWVYGKALRWAEAGATRPGPYAPPK